MVSNTRNSKSFRGLANLLIVSISVALISNSASAQEAKASGIVSGSVVDADFGGVVSDARVAIQGTGLAASTDKDGRFIIMNVPSGEYTVVAIASYYKSSRVEDFEVVAGEITKIDIPLYGDESDIVELDGFTVKAKALAGSNIALLSQRQKSSTISDAIGEDSFSRLGIGDAADALSKTTGTSIVDGKYVVIRGLSDRYNNTTLNGSTVPSADPDKRAVQLDQFPAGIIESIVTTKSFTPDKSGNFTGGSVNVITKSVPDAGFMNVSVGVEYNDRTTNRNYLTYDGGGTDWLGSDDGSREIPQVVLGAVNLPTNPVGRTPEELSLMDEVVKSFNSQIVPMKKKAPLSHSFSVAFGNRYFLNDQPEGPVIGVIGSFNYKRSYSAYDDGQIGRYELVGRDLSLGVSQKFTETKGKDEAQWGSVLNTALILNGNHEFGIKTMYNQSGEDESIFRTGEFSEAVADDTFQVRNIHYTERTLSSYQAYGEHRFEGLSGLELDWEVSTGKSVQEEPDFRLFYDTVPANSGGRPSYTGNFPAPRRYWRDLKETTDEYKYDFTLPIGERSNSIKFGARSTETVRGFSERSFLYQDYRSRPYDGDADSFLAENNLGLGSDGRMYRYVREFIGYVPRYNGKQTVDAAYLMTELRPLEKWRTIFGARLEESEISVESFRSNGEPFGNDGSLKNSDWLPAVQIVNELTPNQNLRFSYSKTLARPNFRELSPFGSFDNVGGEVFIGNPDLVRTRIENLDVRYEWFFEGSDLFAVSLFQKSLENPIEVNYKEGQLTYVNVPKGEVFGLEVEARRKLSFLSGDTSEVSVGGNFSIIDSTVDRSEKEMADKLRRTDEVSPTRELQGQSSLIGNLDVLWTLSEIGSSYSLVYNHTGERLYSVSDSALPDIYESPSDSLDFIYSQSLPKGIKMKLAVKNLLDDSSTRVWSDFEQDLVYSDVRKGTSVSLSFSKRFD